ncbi:hypothetical protein ACIQ6K_23445 [Streptomyces sp. NPDC096354]|uniref:hypothetical protein n=1 Tax=Streptomyces sp. NPDC096354 TaxID=3366088 RepID=UPI003822FA89
MSTHLWSTMRKRTLVLAAAMLTTTTLLGFPAPAIAAAAKYADDFNGDGYRDLAASVLPTAP